MDKLRYGIAKAVYDTLPIKPGSRGAEGFFVLGCKHAVSFAIADEILKTFDIKEKRCETCGQARHS